MDSKSLSTTRVILLADADAFEVQVYQQLDLSSKSKPCVVTNSSGRIVAASYEAKRFGISRDDGTFQKAKLKCSSLVNLKIPQSSDGTSDYTLQRKATNEIVAAIKALCLESAAGAAPILEYSSRDHREEFYIDVTPLIDVIITNYGAIFPTQLAYEAWPKSIVETKHMSLDVLDWNTNKVDEIRLFYGLVIGSKIIDAVKDKTGFQLSVGVGINKLVAKLACGLNKPAAVTLILPDALKQVGERVKIQDIPGLGGKTGENIMNALRGKVMNDLVVPSITVQDISQAGQISPAKAQEIYNSVRGICDKAVVAKDGPDSIMIKQQYNGMRKLEFSQVMDEIRGRIQVILIRAEEEFKWRHRVPMSLKLTIKRPGLASISQRLSYPIEHQNTDEVLDMFIEKMKLDEEWAEDGEPLSYLELKAEPFKGQNGQARN